jgi:endonuclease/exonuclease/phosphatase family metal-dependent hydrolase
MVVVFFNCFLRSPGWLFHDNQSERIKLIPKYTILNNNTLIGLCEVFGKHYGKRLAAEYKKYKYNFFQPKDTSCGLAIAFPNTYELVTYVFHPYKDSKLPDSLANKGFMHCILRCKSCNTLTDVIVTHLQCAYEEDNPRKSSLLRYHQIQKNQLLQLFDYISFRKLYDYILMGDFNIDKNVNPQLFDLLVTLTGYRNKIHLLPNQYTYPSSKTCIDYIFINTNQRNQNSTHHIDTSQHNKITTLQSRAKKLLSTYKNIQHISDHHAVALI